MIKYFDIFAGIGGFRSGLEKAGGFECVGYCEIDRYAKKAYETMYDTGLGYVVIVARAIMLKWTCVEQIIGVPIDYGQAAHINIVS